jgi:hypothetical protein
MMLMRTNVLFYWGAFNNYVEKKKWVGGMNKGKVVQWNLDLRKSDLRKNLDLRKIVGTINFLVHKLFDLRKIF